ncbi:unnamed protein product, partial [Linum tenue]
INVLKQSEDGDVIECIAVQKQPAFDHPALRNHTIQLAPTHDYHQSGKRRPLAPPQPWRKSGSCPHGTIPLRRRRPPKMSTESTSAGQLLLEESPNYMRKNRSAAGYIYSGVKGDIKVWNPNVEDDDYSVSHVGLTSGGRHDFENIRSGWMVNPKFYGDRVTRLFVYWTVDGSNQTGCFDLSCPGFVQTSKEIALGAAINPITLPGDLTSEITIYISRDAVTGNWWVEYGQGAYLGYWPRELFGLLAAGGAETAEWGGEVYSPKLGQRPHTTTAMGSGRPPDPVWGSSGSVKRIRVLENSAELRFPEYVSTYTDEFNCYDVEYWSDYMPDPEFYYGGPGRSYKCP